MYAFCRALTRFQTKRHNLWLFERIVLSYERRRHWRRSSSRTDRNRRTHRTDKSKQRLLFQFSITTLDIRNIEEQNICQLNLESMAGDARRADVARERRRHANGRRCSTSSSTRWLRLCRRRRRRCCCRCWCFVGRFRRRRRRACRDGEPSVENQQRNTRQTTNLN
jgi:hypothetical protein